MLGVWKFAWVMRTIWPGQSELNLIGAPKRLVNEVVFVMINFI